MNKGIVMEITDKSIVVMRPDGKFERVSRKKRNCEIGEEIAYADSGINWRSPSVAGRSAIAAAVIFCLVLFASFNGKLGSPEVVAYVSMDINPSIEMGIDIKENVLELRGLNEDGNELIQDIKFKGETLENVASRLLDKAEQKSLAKGEAEIVIASTVVQENGKVSDAGIATKLREQVTKHIEKTHPAQSSSYQVAAFAAPQEVRQAAAQNGVSMGKYTVYLNAKSSGSEITLDELKKESVLQISKEKPEVAKSIQRDSIPSKADIKKLVEEEKSGQLDKKLEDKKKENGKGSQTTGSQPGKNGQTGQNGQNNQNNKNGQSGQTNQNGQQNGKTDSKTPGSTNGSAVPGKGTDKKDNDKNDKNDDKKDNKQPPAGTKPGTTNPSNPQTKPGATGPGTVRPGDKPDDRKGDDDRKIEQDKKKEDERKQEEVKKSEEQRRKEETDRRLEEQKKKAEEQKKDQDKKEQDKREQDKKEQDKKDDRKQDDSKKNDGKDDDKSRGGDGKKQ